MLKPIDLLLEPEDGKKWMEVVKHVSVIFTITALQNLLIYCQQIMRVTPQPQLSFGHDK